MHIEIERKFLVTDLSWKSGASSYTCKQGYIHSEPGKTIRVRRTDNTAYLTIKSIRNSLARNDVEYEIRAQDAELLLDQLCAKPLIEKTRHLVEFEGFTWEVDEFYGENTGLIIAEIELQDESQSFPRPPWLGTEVTGDPRYYNAALQKKPYSSW